MMDGKSSNEGNVISVFDPRQVTSSNPQCGKGREKELLKKIEVAEAEIKDIKKQRAEDSRANEKVAAMFAAQRQVWKTEKRKLQQQIQSLKNNEPKNSDEEDDDEEENSGECAECAKRQTLLCDIESNFVQALEKVEIFRKEMKILAVERDETERRFSAEISTLKKDLEDKDEVISCLLRKRSEREELERQMLVVESKRSQGDLSRLERHLHFATMRQKHQQEIEAFERQMKAKDERMEVFRQKLLIMDRQLESLKAEKQNMIQNLEEATAVNRTLESLLKKKDRELQSLKEMFGAKGLENGEIKTEEPNVEEHNDERREKSDVNSSIQNVCESESSSSLVGRVPFLRNEENKSDPHVICLIQQAAQAFSPRLKSTLPKLVSPSLRLNGLYRCHETENKDSPEESLTTVVDKYISETCRRGIALEDHTQPEFKLVFEDDKRPLEKCSAGESHDRPEVTELSPAKGEIWKGKSVLAAVESTGKGLPTVGERQVDDKSRSHVNPVKESFASKNGARGSYSSAFCLNNGLKRKLSSSKKNVDTELISKIRGLEQELVQLEELSKIEDSYSSTDITRQAVDKDARNSKERIPTKLDGSSLSAIQLLKKQAKRYQKIIGKINDLCKRIDNENSMLSEDSTASKEQTSAQESQLMESFQLQRYLVATGQKLMAIKTDAADEFHLTHSLDCVQNHLKTIQRSLEIRVARIIGNLEGTLARDGVIHVRT